MGAAMGVRKRAAPKAVPVAVPVYDASIARAFDRELPRTPRGTVDVRAARGDRGSRLRDAFLSCAERSGSDLEHLVEISATFERPRRAPPATGSTSASQPARPRRGPGQRGASLERRHDKAGLTRRRMSAQVARCDRERLRDVVADTNAKVQDHYRAAWTKHGAAEWRDLARWSWFCYVLRRRERSNAAKMIENGPSFVPLGTRPTKRPSRRSAAPASSSWPTTRPRCRRAATWPRAPARARIKKALVAVRGLRLAPTRPAVNG